MPEQEEVKLKPCPFCGSENIHPQLIGGAWRMACWVCFVHTRDGGTAEEAKKNWNIRSSRPPSGEGEAKVWDAFLTASVQGICHAYNVPSSEFQPQGDRSADDWGGIVQSLVAEIISLRSATLRKGEGDEE